MEGERGRGEVMLHDFSVLLERIFEICNHILENAFSLYTISKIMLKLPINCTNIPNTKYQK